MPVKRIHIHSGRSRRLDRKTSIFSNKTSSKVSTTEAPSKLGVDSFFKNDDSGISVVSGSSASSNSGYQDRVSWMGVMSRSVSNAVSVAGLKYAVSARENRARRWLWIMLIMAAMGVSSFQIIEQIKYYRTYPTNVNVDIKYKGELPFPSVAICNFNQYKNAIAGTPFGALINAYIADPWLESDLSEYEASVNQTNMTSILMEYGHGAEDMTYFVQFGLKYFQDVNFTRQVTDFGLCVIFNSEDLFSGPLMVHGTGIRHGLHLWLDVQQYWHGPGELQRRSAGFQIYLFQKGTLPQVNDLGFSIAPGFSTLVGMDLTETTHLPPPHGQCSDVTLKYYDVYGLAECKMECRTDFIINRCGCKAAFMPGNHRECNPSEYLICAKPANDYNFDERSCDCPIPCTSVKYQPFLSSSLFPSDYEQQKMDEGFGEQYNIPADYYRKNLCVLDIFFRELAIHRITEQVAYTLFDLLCDIGGSLGLWLGGSILTIFEVFDLCGQSSYIYSRISRRNNRGLSKV